MKSNNRYLGAAMIAPFIIFVFLGGVYLKAFTFVLSVAALYEFYNAVHAKNFKPINIAGYILLLIYYFCNNNFEIMSNIYFTYYTSYEFEIYIYRCGFNHTWFSICRSFI